MKKFHSVAARFHKGQALDHATLCSSALVAHTELAENHPLRKLVRDIADHHERAAGRHQDFAEQHFAMAKSLGEAGASIDELPEAEELEGQGAKLQRLSQYLAEPM
jgi:hypothetical protein